MGGLHSALKDWGLALAIVIAVLGAWSFINSRGVLTKGPAPTVTLATPRGDIPLEQLQGQVVVLNFWATWCGPCIEEIPEIQAFHQARPDVPIYAVSIDQGMSRARVEATALRYGATYPVVMDEDGQVAGAFGVNTVPTTVVINADGQITSSRVGTLSASKLNSMVDRAAQP